MFRDLPDLGDLVTDLPLWGYPAQTLSGTGAAGLKVWQTTDPSAPGGVGYLAMVTELGLATSITNAAEHIFGKLCADLGTTAVILLERYPTDQDPTEGGHIDQVAVDDTGRPHWRRVWPGSTDPARDAWARRHLSALLT